MNPIRLKRLNNAFVEEISKILYEEIKDPDIKFVTITSCSITNDLSFAKVYYTVLDDSKKKSTADALNGASAYVRSLLSQRVDIRNTPALRFVYDDSIEYGNKIDAVIAEVKKHDEVIKKESN